jgi:DNA-directed RNA polymerase specialized sigma24 family protein
MDRADEFAAFYAGAFARPVGQLLLVTGELHEAEDVVQEALARASTPPAAGDRAAPPARHARPRGGRDPAGPTGTVKTRLARGRQALAARLTERGSEEVRSHR